MRTWAVCISVLILAGAIAVAQQPAPHPLVVSGLGEECKIPS